MTLPVRVKQPAEVVTIPFEYAPCLLEGTTLTGSPTATADAGLSVLGSSVSGTRCLVQVSGGTLGVTYKVTCKISATNGDLHELDVNLRIAEEN